MRSIALREAVDVEARRRTRVIHSGWSKWDNCYTLSIMTLDRETERTWHLAPGERIPTMKFDSDHRKCMWGLYARMPLCGADVSGDDDDDDAAQDPTCALHQQPFFVCSFRLPGAGVGQSGRCRENARLCSSIECLGDNVVYIGLFADGYSALKIGQSADWQNRVPNQGLNAVTLLLNEDGGKMSLFRTKELESRIGNLLKGIDFRTKKNTYKPSTKPYHPIRRKDLAEHALYYNADPERVAAELTEMLPELRRRILTQPWARGLQLTDVHTMEPRTDGLVDHERLAHLVNAKATVKMHHKTRGHLPGGTILAALGPYILVEADDGSLHSFRPSNFSGMPLLEEVPQ